MQYSAVLCSALQYSVVEYGGVRSNEVHGLNVVVNTDWPESIYNLYLHSWIGGQHTLKLDGVGPVDNRPPTNKLHNFVQKKLNLKYIIIIVKCHTWHVTSDTWHATPDIWHMTYDTWQVTGDMWHSVGVNMLLKFWLPTITALNYSITQLLNYGTQLRHSITALNFGTQLRHLSKTL